MTTTQPLNWLLLSTLTLGVLWLLYHVALRRERCFQYNRTLLLLAPLLAVLLPLAHLPTAWLPAASTAQTPLRLLLPAVTVGASATNASTTPLLFWVLLLYGAGVGLLLGRLGWQLLMLWRFTRTLPTEQHADYTLRLTRGQRPTGSFGRTVYWDDTAPLSAAEAAQVLRHELVHVRQHHTLDRLWLRVWQALLWPNPFVHLLPRALDLTHEYLADAAVTPATSMEYIRLLARQATGWLGQAPTLAHSFFSSSTLTRIAMLNRSSVPRRWKQWLALPVCAGLLFVVACEKNMPADDTLSAQAQAAAKQVSTTPPPPPVVYRTVAEKMPEPEGGFSALANYIALNVQYPKSAKAQGLEGTALISFIVDSDGSIQAVELEKGVEQEFAVETTPNTHPISITSYLPEAKEPGEKPVSDAPNGMATPAMQEMNEEAVRIVREMPHWKPGRQQGKPVAVQFHLPIKYELQ